jgi:dienelactone hydrolase
MKHILSIISIMILASCSSYTPGKISTTLSSESFGVIWFESNDGYDFSGFSSAPSITMEGALTIPENHNGSAVILSHGSGGVSRLHERWKEFLVESGYAVFLLDHFRPRSVINTLHSQVRVTEQQMAFDILNAYSLLGSHPSIGGERVFHMGWSKGATAGILASFDKVNQLVFGGQRTSTIAGFVEFYPWCGVRAKIATTSPLLILHGTDDDYTPLSFCRTLVDDINSTGGDAEIVSFESAVHGFDDWNLPVGPQNYLTVRSSSDDCILKIDPTNLGVTSVNGKFSVGSYSARKEFLSNCAEGGVQYGGAKQHQDQTEKIVLDFLSGAYSGKR